MRLKRLELEQRTEIGVVKVTKINWENGTNNISRVSALIQQIVDSTTSAVPLCRSPPPQIYVTNTYIYYILPFLCM